MGWPYPAWVTHVTWASGKHLRLPWQGGSVVREIRDSTGAKVKLDDSIPGLPERAVIIYSPDRPGEPTCGAQDALERVVVRMFEPDGPNSSTPVPEHVQLVRRRERERGGE